MAGAGSTAAQTTVDARRRRLVLWTVLVGVGATNFPVTVFGASLPKVARDLHTSQDTITWVVSAPLLAFAVAMPVLGKLGDLSGHRRVYLWGLGVATLLSLATALAWDPFSLIALRTLGQLAGAATITASLALIMSVYPPEDRAGAIGWWSMVTAAAPLIGLLVGGPLIDAIGWRVLFVAQAVPSLVALLVAVPALTETKTKPGVGFDVSGGLTLAAGIGGALFALNRAGPWGWASPTVLGALVAGVGFLVAFTAVERRARDPLVPLDFLARRNFTAPMGAQLFQSAAYMGGFVITPFLLDRTFGYSATAITLVATFRPLAFSAAGPVGGWASARFGERATSAFGSALVALGMPALALGATQHSLAFVILGLIASGAGNGVSRAPLTTSMANAVDESDLGIAGASLNMVGQIGAATGITLLTVLQGASATPAAFARALDVGGIVAAIAVVWCLFIDSLHREPAPPEELAEEMLAAVP